MDKERRKVQDCGSCRFESETFVDQPSLPASGAMVRDGEGKDDFKKP